MANNDRTYRTKPTASKSTSRPSVKASGAKKQGKASGSTRKGSSQSAKSTTTSRRTAAPRASQKKNPRPASHASKRSADRVNSQSRIRSSKSRKTTAVNAGGAGERALSAAGSGLRALFSNRIAAIVIIVLLVIVIAAIADSVANMNKAYGNVTINGIEVGGMTAEEIDSTLRDQLATTVSHNQAKIYASEKAKSNDVGNLSDEERLARIEQVAQAEQISVEQATAQVQSWTTDALALKAAVPYEDLAAQALAVGREDGGIISRLGLFFVPHAINVNLTYDDAAVDALASEIDRTVGDLRIDAGVAIENGEAHPQEGHDGRMVDRDWLKQKLSEALTSKSGETGFVAQVSTAPSRITIKQAQETSDAVNRALQAGAVFSYKGKDWNAYGEEIGRWTQVKTVEDGNGGYKLGVSIDDAAAIPMVVTGAGAAVKSDNVTVKFAKNNEGEVIVRTFGEGNIPEVTPAIKELDEALYGDNGIAWKGGSGEPVRIEIVETDAPAALTLEQAIELGIVTNIGEYTTEFSNYEGTENRNHNIKLVADILDNSIVDSNGGEWKFNDRSGDTNEAAGFWSAGSIIEGEYVDSVGGGICQVATTIFNAVYEAGLPINMRFCHQLYIASYPPGRDASVSYPDMDLWWTNDLTSDVLLDLSYTDTTVTARIYSVYTGYTVESTYGNWEKGAEFALKFEEDADLAKDEYYTKTTGEDGSHISVTRIVKNEAGEVISDQVFESTYDAKDEVVVIGPGTDTSKIKKSESGDTISYRPNGDEG